jgi:ribonuclease E
VAARSEAAPAVAADTPDQDPPEAAPAREPRRRRVRRRSSAAVEAVADLSEVEADVEVTETVVPEPEVVAEVAESGAELEVAEAIVVEIPANEEPAAESGNDTPDLASELPLPEGEITAPPEKPKRGWWRLGR